MVSRIKILPQFILTAALLFTHSSYSVIHSLHRGKPTKTYSYTILGGQLYHTIKMITTLYHFQLISITLVSNYAQLSQEKSSHRILRGKIVGVKDDLMAG